MKRLLTLVITMFLGAGLTLAQTDKGKALNPQPLPPGKVAPANKTAANKGGKKGHKGGKKGKKGSSGNTTPTPK
jgi:hypothetical protein